MQNMTRLPFMLIFALLNFSATDVSGAISPSAPGLPDASFPTGDLPKVQASPACPVSNCVVDPVSLTRERKAPAKAVSEFLAAEGQEAELVVVISHRTRATVRAWMNGETVLLPSALPRSGTNEVRVPVTLAEQNVLEFRLTGRIGTEVVFWIESGDATPPPPGDTGPTMEFRLSNSAVGPTASMNAVCSADHGDSFGIADWSDVVSGTDPSPIQAAGIAWIQWDDLGSFSTSFFGPTYHYQVSAIGNLNPNFYYGTIGVEPNQFWLNADGGMRPVLCKGPASSGLRCP